METFMSRFLVFLLSVLGLPVLSCIADEEQVARPAPITQISVQRTWCYGDCPIDSLVLNSDGRASYSGFRNASRNGFFRGVLAPDQFSGLAAFLESQNYFELKPEIGMGNIDAPDFLIGVVRGGLPYNVTFRIGGSALLEAKMKKPFLDVAEQIQWQRDDSASESGVSGTVRRPLTRYEASSLRERKPPVTSFPMRFALVTLRSRDAKGEEISTRSDGEGRFQFFAPPGRYDVSVSTYNFAQPHALGAPLYLAPSQTIVVEAKKFAAPVLHFEDKTPLLR